MPRRHARSSRGPSGLACEVWRRRLRRLRLLRYDARRRTSTTTRGGAQGAAAGGGPPRRTEHAAARTSRGARGGRRGVYGRRRGRAAPPALEPTAPAPPTAARSAAAEPATVPDDEGESRSCPAPPSCPEVGDRATSSSARRPPCRQPPPRRSCWRRPRRTTRRVRDCTRPLESSRGAAPGTRSTSVCSPSATPRHHRVVRARDQRIARRRDLAHRTGLLHRLLEAPPGRPRASRGSSHRASCATRPSSARSSSATPAAISAPPTATTPSAGRSLNPNDDSGDADDESPNPRRNRRTSPAPVALGEPALLDDVRSTSC